MHLRSQLDDGGLLDTHWSYLVVPLCLSHLYHSTRESRLDFARRGGARLCRTIPCQGNARSFLEFLAEDSILFRPGPVPGRKWIEEHPAPPNLLTWEPAFADVAQSGDLGYTTGPWEIRPKSPQEYPPPMDSTSQCGSDRLMAFGGSW